MKIFRYIGFLLLCLNYLNAQVLFECKGKYYLSLTRSGAQSSGLYEVKINPDGTKIFLDTISPSIGLVLNGMGYRITDNFIYGMDPNTPRLRKIGRDGVALDLGLPAGIPTDRVYFAGDVTPDGRYLILIGLGGSPAQIVKVDLESPVFQCTFVPLKTSVSIVDVAFDPFSGKMYGHDLANKRLVIINPDDGTVDVNFIRQPQVDQLGALFFDSFGNLFGYGAFGQIDVDIINDQSRILFLDKATFQNIFLVDGQPDFIRRIINDILNIFRIGTWIGVHPFKIVFQLGLRFVAVDPINKCLNTPSAFRNGFIKKLIGVLMVEYIS